MPDETKRETPVAADAPQAADAPKAASEAPKAGAEAPDAAAAATPVTLVYLDVDDEITSAAARIRAAGAERVALVLPYGSRLATSRINFRLLAREAAARGEAHRDHLRRCVGSGTRPGRRAPGLPVRGRVRGPRRWIAGSLRSDWRKRRREHGGRRRRLGRRDRRCVGRRRHQALDPADDTQTRALPIPRRSSPRVPIVGPARPPLRPRFAVGIGLAAVAIVLVGGFLALELLPSATIVLHPRSREVGPLELTVEARVDVTEPDAEALVIPAEEVTFGLQASDTFPATGVKVVETKATGNVRFSNFDTGRGVLIPKGTDVRTKLASSSRRSPRSRCLAPHSTSFRRSGSPIGRATSA